MIVISLGIPLEVMKPGTIYRESFMAEGYTRARVCVVPAIMG